MFTRSPSKKFKVIYFTFFQISRKVKIITLTFLRIWLLFKFPKSHALTFGWLDLTLPKKMTVCGVAQWRTCSTWMLRYPRSIPVLEKKYSIFSTEYFWAMLSQVSVEHDNNYWVNCVKSQDCRRTLAGEARTKAGNEKKKKKLIFINFLLISYTFLSKFDID